MSVPAIQWARALDLPRAPAAVLRVLAEFHNESLGVAWPSLPLIAKRARYGERRVRDALRWLERKAQLIAAASSGTGGRGISTRYRLSMDRQAAEVPGETWRAPRLARAAAVENPATVAQENPAIGDLETRQLLHENPAEIAADSLLDSELEERTPLPPAGGGAETKAKLDYRPRLFAEAFNLYPKRVQRGKAWRAWCAAIRAGHDPGAILGGLEGAVDMAEFDMRERGRWCPSFASWLRAESFNDGIAVDESGSGNAGALPSAAVIAAKAGGQARGLGA